MSVFWPTSADAILRNAACAIGVLLTSTSIVSATVFEYDSEGAVSIKETEKSRPQVKRTEPSPSTSTKLVSLTREIALQYSGSIGVRKAGLDALTFVELFETLIRRESAFDPQVVSEKGAMGLGQLMPGTATDMGVSDPFDPRANLVGSAKYFTSMLHQFGSVELALAAYNAGPERVRQYNGVPPFAETKAYVSWIIEKAGIATSKPKPVASTPVAAPINKENPLQGDVSVWEF